MCAVRRSKAIPSFRWQTETFAEACRGELAVDNALMKDANRALGLDMKPAAENRNLAFTGYPGGENVRSRTD